MQATLITPVSFRMLRFHIYGLGCAESGRARLMSALSGFSYHADDFYITHDAVRTSGFIQHAV